MKKSEFIMKEHINNTRPFSAIHKYISYLDSKKNETTLKLSHARYFGPYRLTRFRWIEQLQLSNQSRTYKKMVKDQCLYTSSKRINLRSDNSFAVTKRKSFIRIIGFIVDETSRKEFTLFNEIYTENIFEDFTAIKKVTDISKEVQAIETNDIYRICVFIDTGTEKYISSVPNLCMY